MTEVNNEKILDRHRATQLLFSYSRISTDVFLLAARKKSSEYARAMAFHRDGLREQGQAVPEPLTCSLG